ncbi:DNA-3-methyladenine glycosylase I [Eisenibacter elegans]|jgi:DNA-3-methyladenine glycosylase I|uniref:DNA-3-methyladenine glycosylase I n=1 Tax=Eisenibacter elegans TaxID=997 RepID=UPI00040BA6F0|nr:DNA-3-methyladenine glycosylase I [Eisenibacter elegans]
MSYCAYVKSLTEADNLHKIYHDQHYGFPIREDDGALFGRLLLEINQAGLSWELMLRKEAHFRQAYAQFSVAKVAAFDAADEARLLADAGIVRNRLKVAAAIYNAKVILQLQQSHGSFEQWILAHHPLPKEQWVKLFKQHFKFMGGEIVGEFLMSIGILPGAHQPNCPVYAQVLAAKPAWAEHT